VRRRRLALLLLPAAIPLLATAACGDDAGSADATAFCQHLERLTENDPFAAFGDRADDEQIEEAFHALVARSEELVDLAPDEERPTARDYADAARGLDEIMAAAGYDGARLDARAYRDQQVRYADAAARLERYLQTCPGVATSSTSAAAGP
jgi:hypothetical protein